MRQFIDRVRAQIPELFLLENEPMSRHTTFGIGGPADWFASPRRDELAPLLALAGAAGVPVTVLGHGSNVLVGDGGIRGLVVEIGGRMSAVHTDGKLVVAEAGALLSSAAAAAARAGLGGMEFAAGIPGSVGGAAVMNAGAYGGEIKDILRSALVIGPDGGQKELSAGDLKLGYRSSCIPRMGYTVISAVFALTPDSEEQIRLRMSELNRRRSEKQPLEYPSAGSAFKRPEGHFAGKLIMDAGLAGYRVGGAQVSEKHCGFVINRGGATAADVRQLLWDVKKRVWDMFQVELEPEVKMLGSF